MKKKTAEERLEWLRSQLVGRDHEINTPFGKRLLTYADHTASGRCLHDIENYIIQKVLPYYGNTHTTDSFVGGKTTELAQKASEYIKRCMGGDAKDALIFCGNGTTAAIKRLQEVIGITVPPTMRDRLLSTVVKDERWVVFVGPYEHHSNILSWRQSIAEVVEIGVDADGVIDMEELRRELSSPKYANRPMLGSFSACSNVSGIVTDTRALASLLHDYGAFACFDFAASGPYVKIDMRSGTREGYDAVFLSPHKFVGGPGTPGILLMSKYLYQLTNSPPSTCGGGTVDYVNGFNELDTLYSTDIEEREDAGTPAIVQKVKAALAFWVKEYIGYKVIGMHDTFYANTAVERLLRNKNIRVLGNVRVKRLPILSFLVFPSLSKNIFGDDEKRMPLDGRFVAKLLNDLFGIQARGGCACAGPYGHYLLNVDEAASLDVRRLIQKGYQGVKPGWTRVSFAYYMSREEFSFILSCIDFIADYGHRFLPLYDFDWCSGNWTFLKQSLKDVSSPLTWKPAQEKMRNAVKGNGSYAAYLRSAKRVADSLPDDPKPRAIPRGIDGPILFRI